jgi:hypothetical protein
MWESFDSLGCLQKSFRYLFLSTNNCEPITNQTYGVGEIIKCRSWFRVFHRVKTRNPTSLLYNNCRVSSSSFHSDSGTPTYAPDRTYGVGEVGRRSACRPHQIVGGKPPTYQYIINMAIIRMMTMPPQSYSPIERGGFRRSRKTGCVLEWQ